jgi:hypothetical protein
MAAGDSEGEEEEGYMVQRDFKGVWGLGMGFSCSRSAFFGVLCST